MNSEPQTFMMLTFAAVGLLLLTKSALMLVMQRDVDTRSRALQCGLLATVPILAAFFMALGDL